MKSFLIALQFLTRLPVRLSDLPTASESGRSLLYYPAVGLVIGMMLVLLAAACSALRMSSMLGAALLLATWAGITGGLHLDGLADSADAWVGGHGDRERTLTIMKDPACGPMGVLALVVLMLLKFAALSASLSHTHSPTLTIALAPVLGRTALPLLFLTTPYIRPGGLGSLLVEHLNRQTATAMVGATVLVVIGGCGWIGLLATITGIAVFVMLRRMMMKTLGGTTGDTAGAMVELIETAVLVVLSSLDASHLAGTPIAMLAALVDRST